MKFDFFLELKLCTVIGMQACRIVALHYTTKDRLLLEAVVITNIFFFEEGRARFFQQR